MTRSISIPRLYAVFLVLINIAAMFWMLSTGMLIGDVRGFPIQSYEVILVSGIVVCLSILSVVLLHFLCSNIRLPFNHTFIFTKPIRKRLMAIILALQSSYLLFCLVNGVNISGSGNEGTTSPLRFLWVFLNVDLLFILSYPVLRKDKNFKYLIVLQIVSALARGSSGVILMVFILECAWRHRLGVLKWRPIFLGGAAVLIAYPIINIIKFTVRLAFKNNQGFDVTSVALLQSTLSEGYVVAIVKGAGHLIERLQLVSLASEVWRLKSTVQSLFDNGGFFPFWSEGLHGILFDAILSNERNVPIGTAFTLIGRFGWDFEYGDWNTNVGLAGWILALPLFSPFLVTYLFFLCLLSVTLSKLVSRTKFSKDIVLLLFLSFLVPAWFQPFVSLIITQFIFLILCFFLGGRLSVARYEVEP